MQSPKLAVTDNGLPPSREATGVDSTNCLNVSTFSIMASF